MAGLDHVGPSVVDRGAAGGRNNSVPSGVSTLRLRQDGTVYDLLDGGGPHGGRLRDWVRRPGHH